MSSKERFQELAALNAAGALEGTDAAEFNRLRDARDPDLLAEIAAFQLVADGLSLGSGPVAPPVGLRARLLGRLGSKASASAPAPVSAPVEAKPAAFVPPANPFTFLRNNDDSGWLPLPVKGAYVKPLHIETERGYAVVLGKLDPGTHYPAHSHLGPEQIYMLTGDLHIGDEALGPGDFHHAGPGTQHGVNHSVNGCTILVVLSLADLQAQMV